MHIIEIRPFDSVNIQDWSEIKFNWSEYDDDDNVWIDKEARMLEWIEEYEGVGQCAWDNSSGKLYIENEEDAAFISMRWS